MCSVISAYRLLDVIALLSGVSPAPSVERRFFQIPNKSFRVRSIIYHHSVHAQIFAGNGQAGQLAISVDTIPGGTYQFEEDISVPASNHSYPVSLAVSDRTQQYQQELQCYRVKLSLCRNAFGLYEGAPFSKGYVP
jgi:hypothetical protein